MVRDQGAAMIDNKFDEPDREELDQMGELIHALKAYRDWTGDDSLIRQHRAKLVALVERPLGPGVPRRRPAWSTTAASSGSGRSTTATKLAYQTYMVLGLRDAAELAGPLGVPDRAGRWRAEADRILQAMLAHPNVLAGATTAVSSSAVAATAGASYGSRPRRGRFVPGKTESVHLADPDATLALADRLRLIDPHSELAARDAR